MTTPAPKAAAVFKDSKLKLFASPFSAGDGAPSLALSFFRSNVGFAVYTNTERDPNPNKYINAGLSLVEMYKVFQVLTAYATGNKEGWPNPTIIENKQNSEPGNQNSPLVVASYLTIGVGDDGAIFIRVEDADDSRPKITFEFGHSKWHTWLDQSGAKQSVSKVSSLACLSTIDAWKSLMPDAVIETFTDTSTPAGEGGEKPAGGGNYEKKPWQGNNNGGQKQWNNNGGGGGYQKKPWQGNNNGNGGGGYQKKPWQGNGGGGNNYRGGNGGGRQYNNDGDG